MYIYIDIYIYEKIYIERERERFTCLLAYLLEYGHASSCICISAYVSYIMNKRGCE